VELEIAFVLAAIVVWASFDGYRRTLWQVNKYASWEMWPEVLQEAAGLRRGSYSFGALHVVTRALYETGQLPSQMFSYPQHRGGFALAWGLAAPRAITVVRRVQPMEVKRAVITDVQSDDWYNKRMHHFFTLGNLNLKLGLVNEAEHEAHEALELFGDHPQVLKQLAMLNIVKGQTEAARAFLQALRPYIHHGEWAAETLSRLETDPLLLGDKHVQEVRSVMLEQRSLALGPSLDERFDALLQKNRRNRMAFEYRMAFYLLHLLLDEFAREFGRLDDFGYPAIPRHYEEAILIYESISGQKVDLHGRQISEGTRQAYEQFCKALDFFHRLGDRQGAQATLERGFGRTYFYYYFLGES
jgi:tetratricopeptide (TPR) repeat protein